MADPISVALTVFVASNAPSWLASLRGTLLDKGRELAINKGKERGGQLVRNLLHLDEKEQLRHLEQALKNATERGLVAFDTLAQRDQYKDILRTLSQPGPQGVLLRQEIMQLFTLSDKPALAALSDKYNQRQRFYNAAYQDIDAAPYLSSFFSALLTELYADPYFRMQLSDVLQLRAATSTQQSLFDIVVVLKGIGETLADTYTAQDLMCDIEAYAAYIERTLRNLKIVGVVPKDQNADPELSGVFVPLRIALSKQTTHVRVPSDEQTSHDEEQPDALVAMLEQHPYLVLLGGPGSGKSTATKYLAWAHAAANRSAHPVENQLLALTHPSLLSGNPLPLRIELRRLSEERKRANYDFLSFVVQVLLKRDGIEINPHMFKELLARRALLLLFDGLDEVATLDERRGLVEEIEHFALAYPGNRVLVTSRPVGYDLTRISHPLFADAEVQSFNDEQIQQFLKNWYTAVLRLSPIPQREQEEMGLLLTTLQANPRLHKLAENPLLLTVITVLHRYERLPDRRVLVYDRCADLLLETWAKLRGTDMRWEDLKLSKEDQYVCVAFLGFVLHKRSQEEVLADNDEPAGMTVDVPSRFLRTNVESFLKERDLIIGRAERNKVASRFIQLVQEEAGLIVERGTAENGEALYSFVHRTFQEYFAAADIYERYQQQEDPAIISEFLMENLHDPHWREVIFLLLSKLKSTPVTNQLRQILQGKIKSHRSAYTEIIQQDLFFICDCLLEEIKVENTLIDAVRLRLSDVVKSSPFPAQRREALEYLGKLAQTRQYIGQGYKELLTFAMDAALDEMTRLESAQILYISSPALSEERRQANQVLTTLLLHGDLTIDQMRGMADSLDMRSAKGSEAQQLATLMLSMLLTHTNSTVEQMRRTAETLYRSSAEGLEAQQLATSTLRMLLTRQDLTAKQAWETAESLYHNSAEGSDDKQLAISTLRTLLTCEDLAVEQMRRTAESLYGSGVERKELETQQLAASMLSMLLTRGDLTVEQVSETAELLYRISAEGSENEQLATSMLRTLLKRVDLTVEQIREIAEFLYDSSAEGSDDRWLGTSMLRTLLKREDLTVEQIQEIAESLYNSSAEGSDDEQLATSMLRSLLKRGDLTAKQPWKTMEFLYHNSVKGSADKQLATSMLMTLPMCRDLAVEQARR